jgi:octaprenyl-diphosphate synthase
MLKKIINPYDKLKSVLADDLSKVSKLIKERMQSEHAPLIGEISNHLIGSGGKRLRPLLTLAAAKICGYQGEFHIHLAATVEFIHTATLLHDDVVDESERRRGKSSVNILWNNSSSVLVGDYLFARSFQLMTETGRLDVLETLSNASANIAEGEVLQLTSSEDITTDEETYYKIIRGKTAALFSASTEVGAMLADADKNTTKALTAYGDALGVSFQIVDDIFDFVGDGAKIGKNLGDDFRERKLTLPMIHAISKADDKDLKFWERTIVEGDQTSEDFEKALDILKNRLSIDYSKGIAIEWSKTAKKTLTNLPDTPLRSILEELAEYVVSRVN